LTKVRTSEPCGLIVVLRESTDFGGTLRTSNKTEHVHDFAAHLNFGSHGILRTNSLVGQEKAVIDYNLAVLRQIHVSLDYQFVKNPAYNRDRGAVSIVAVRFHAQF
jgi:hypothetical protein